MIGKDLLIKYGQEQLLRFQNELSKDDLAILEKDLEEVDFDMTKSLFESVSKTKEEEPIASFEPFPPFIQPDENTDEYKKYYEFGLKSIKEGAVIAVTMAGGMGSRLSFDGPKGAYDIGLYEKYSIFEIDARSLKSVSQKAGRVIPWYIMTSNITDRQTKKFFEDNDYFGYPENSIGFFT